MSLYDQPKFDFHCHSNYSDGGLSPTALIDYASERDIKYLALTDHDSISGLAEARQHILATNSEMQLISGVEISALSEFGEIHIVGLGVDESNSLETALAQQRTKRWQRAEEIDAKLQKLAVTGMLDWCRENVKQVVTRTHMSQAIVALGYAKDNNQVFKRYLGHKGKVKVPKIWMSLEEAIALIKKAGGTSVLAHPTRYPLSNRKLSYLIQEFSELGGDAIEMAYPSLNADKSAWLELQREGFDMLASSGSDFHFPDLRWTDLGRFPNLSREIPHVSARFF